MARVINICRSIVHCEQELRRVDIAFPVERGGRKGGDDVREKGRRGGGVP